MSPAPRRFLIAWLLLLVPTFVVGAGALRLVRLEQQRIDERARATLESRRAAVEARVALIAENLQLLADEARQGLMATLRELDEPDVGHFFAGWEASNPLVAAAFHVSGAGHVMRPVDGSLREALTAWIAAGSPWVKAVPALAAPPAEEGSATVSTFAAPAPTDALRFNEIEQAVPVPSTVPIEVSARQRSEQIAANVMQLQQARSAVQQTAALKAVPDEAAALESASDSSAIAAGGGIASAAPSAGRDDRAESERRRRSALALERRAEGFEPGAPPSLALGGAAVAPPPMRRLQEGLAERSGWSVWHAEAPAPGRPRLFGWRLRPAGDVVGLELAVDALAVRLAAALPRAVGADEAYALRRITAESGEGTTALYSKAKPDERTWVLRVALPLPLELLPGWEVVGFLAPNGAEASWTGGGFFLVNAVVVAALVAAILAGGALLWREARRSEAEAAQKTSFVSHVSHELRTPLTTIRLYTELLEQDRVTEPARRGELLRTIGEETRRLARLVDRVLDFSRLQRGAPPPARVALDVRAELERLLALHAPRLAEAGLALHRELPAGPLIVTTAPDALGQIVLNLLDNAAKYAAGGEEVTVALAARPGGGAEVRVRDRGPGVPAAHAARIFEPFHRVDDSLTAGSGGTGLGLGIARSLARSLGGDLRYAPRPGGGADFVLTLP